MYLIKKYRIQIFIFAITFSLLFHIFIRGYNPQDEGWVLYASMRLLDGAIPYKDFQYLYTPLTAILGALSFSIFGVSILSERLLALFIACLTSVFLYNIFSLLRIKKYISFLLVLLFIAWGPLHTNYLSPAIISVELGILYLYFLLKALMIKDLKVKNISFFLSGALLIFIILTKQSFGAAVVLHASILFVYLVVLKAKKTLIFFLLGILIPSTLYFFYLIQTSSLAAFYNEMYSFLILDAIVGDGFKYQTPLSFPAPILYKFAKISLYSFPVVISFFAMMLCIQKKSKTFFIPLLCITFYFAGIQPVMDTVHLTPIIGFSALGFGVLFTMTKSGKVHLLLMASICILILLGAYNGIFRGYFKWFAPIYMSNIPLQSSRARILINRNDAQSINIVVDYLSTHSGKNEYIFNYGMTPILYFLADRRSASRFNTIETRNVQGESLQILLHDLQVNKPKIIVSDGQFRGINPEIEKYILQYYTEKESIGGRPIFFLREIEP